MFAEVKYMHYLTDAFLKPGRHESPDLAFLPKLGWYPNSWIYVFAIPAKEIA